MIVHNLALTPLESDTRKGTVELSLKERKLVALVINTGQSVDRT